MTVRIRQCTVLPYTADEQQIHAAIFASERPDPPHGPRIRFWKTVPCTPIAITKPNRDGWRFEYCRCGRFRETHPATRRLGRWTKRYERPY